MNTTELDASCHLSPEGISALVEEKSPNTHGEPLQIGWILELSPQVQHQAIITAREFPSNEGSARFDKITIVTITKSITGRFQSCAIYEHQNIEAS